MGVGAAGSTGGGDCPVADPLIMITKNEVKEGAEFDEIYFERVGITLKKLEEIIKKSK